MAKKVQTTIKLQLPAGKATPAPPVGTALGPHGLNIMDFCKQFNAKTAKEPDGMIFPVLVTVYTDRTFTYCEGFRGAESQQGRQSDEEASRRDRQDQVSGSQYDKYRIRGAHRDGYGAKHGAGSRSVRIFRLRGQR